jgi:ribosomal protein L11 methyltransferase
VEVIVDVPARAEEDLAQALCHAGALGVRVENVVSSRKESGHRTLHAYFEAGHALPGKEDLERLCPHARPLKILSRASVTDGRWVEQWVASLAPMEIGRRLRIAPIADLDQASVAPVKREPGEGGRISIRILPGRAFGTGEHATTRLCLEAMEEKDLRGRSLLDVGTGSGILAIAGKALGCGRAVAIDNDPEAVAVAVSNARLNAMRRQIAFACAGPESVSARFQMVVANLNGGILERCMERLAEATEPGGILILSGILEAEIESILFRARLVHLSSMQTTIRGEWACAVLERAGA